MKKITFLLLILPIFGFSQNTTIPDINFEQALIDLGIDTNPTIDGVVPTANISGVITLDVSSKTITDLTGIEGFTALTELYCYYNQLTSLDVSANTGLTWLVCHHNQLSSLNVSTNTALTYLECADNLLTSLNVNTNTALTNLHCYNNLLTSLNVSANTALTTLNCSDNQLSSLDMSTNTALDVLGCKSNLLTSLNVSTNTALTNLQCYNNLLTSLNVSANTALTRLFCYDNQLSSLDVNTNTVLTRLWCSLNQLTSLDVSTNTALTRLYCENNLLTSLDVSTNTALTRLRCQDNQLTSLDVRNGYNTAISNSNFNANNNPNLTCILVDNATWSNTNWYYIGAASTFVNNETECTALSIQDNTFGSEFNVYPNPSFGLSKIQLGESYTNVSVNIFNVLGKQVATQTHNNTNVIELNTQQFTTGIYFIKVQSGAKEATIKLVVN